MSISTTSNLFGFDINSVPDIDFCVKDASLIESDVIGSYQNLFYLATQIQKTLGRGDPVRLFLLAVIYQIVVQRSIVDSTGKENLLKYTRADDLDNVAAKWGPLGLRLQPNQAVTTILFTLGSVLGVDSTIPAGTIIQTGDGQQFTTDIDVTISAGNLTVSVSAHAVIAGTQANSIVAGLITDILTPVFLFVVSASNTTTTSGGTDLETDDHFRARVWMAPEALSTAGPKEGYMYWAASANADIMDVSVWSDLAHAGQVYVYLLMVGARLPTTDECNQVYISCNADDVRPLTDQVFVQAPTTVPYTITATYYVRTSDSAFSIAIQEAATTAFQTYQTWQQSKIGRDINIDMLIQLAKEAGVKRIAFTSTSFFTVVDDQHVAKDSGLSTFVFGGLEDE